MEYAMSLFSLWCYVSAGLLFNLFIYGFMNRKLVADLARASMLNRSIVLPATIYGQLTFRGMFFLLGSVLVGAVAYWFIEVSAYFFGPFRAAESAFVVLAWLGGLCCAAFSRLGAAISFWTAWMIQCETC